MARSSVAVPLRLALYKDQVLTWPASGNHILAQYDEESIIVYQAFNDRIADAVVKANNFHSSDVLKVGYSINRMTWIKTNFLWMMYRSGWASKDANQKRILGIQLSRRGFEEILMNAEKKGADSGVRLQWDPDHSPSGEKILTGRRAIQLGLRGAMLEKFSREFIIAIHDVTDFVMEQAKNVSESCDLLVTPEERVYKCLDKRAAEIVGVDNPL